jgi:hypothetical protein
MTHIQLPESRVQALQLKQRVEALKLLERALLTCQRLDDEKEKLKAQANASAAASSASQNKSVANDKEGEANHATSASSSSSSSSSAAAASAAAAAQAANIISPISKYEHGLMSLATEGCVLVWNIAKPLLRSSLRKHAHRAMGLAATYLANNHSPLQSVRAALHLELAKCEISTDFLAKAAEHLTAASLCDYGLIVAEEANPPTKSQELLQNLLTELNLMNSMEISASSSSSSMAANQMKLRLSSNESDDMSSVGKYSVHDDDDDEGEEEEMVVGQGNGTKRSETAQELDEHGRRRKLDAFIDHTQLKLSLKKSIYEEPTLIEERALLIIEQAKEVTNLTLQASLLTQAEKLLATASPAAQTTGATSATGGGGGGGTTSVSRKAKRELDEDGAGSQLGGASSTKQSSLEKLTKQVVKVEDYATPEADGRIKLNQNKGEGTLVDDNGGGKVDGGKPAALVKAGSIRGGGGGSVAGKSKGGGDSVASSTGKSSVINAERDWSKIPPPEPRNKMRANLFSEIIELAWSHPHQDTVPLVHKSVSSLLSGPAWNPVRYTSFVALQVRAQYVLAETYGCLVSSFDESDFLPSDYEVSSASLSLTHTLSLSL